MKLKNLTRNNIILLICLSSLIILVPLVSNQYVFVLDIVFSVTIFSGVFSLDFSSRSLKILLPLSVITVATIWISHFVENDVIALLNYVNTFAFLVAILVLMVRHVATEPNITAELVLNSINGYLLLGSLGGVLLSVLSRGHRLLYSEYVPIINVPGDAEPRFFDFLYFSFITLSTLGYGDLTPATSLARSISILIAIAGQLYLTVLIAMLIGKFLSKDRGESAS